MNCWKEIYMIMIAQDIFPFPNCRPSQNKFWSELVLALGIRSYDYIEDIQLFIY